MPHLWLLNLGFPLIVLGFRLMTIRNSLFRARRAAETSPEHKEILIRLQVPWKEGIRLTAVGVIVLAVGLIYYLLPSHLEFWALVNAGALLAILGLGQLIQTYIQRGPESQRLKSECLVRIFAWVVVWVGAGFILAYAIHFH